MNINIKMKLRFIILLLLIVFITIFAISGIVIAKEPNNNTTNKELTYVEIIVQEGDTLWNIARPYYDGKSDYRKFIHEIRKLNDLNEGIIYPGQIIIIPSA